MREVRLRGRDIILESVGDGLEHIVYDTQYIITLIDGINDYPDSVPVIDLFYILAVTVDFLIYTVIALDSS